MLNFDKRIREITYKSSSLSGVINSSLIQKPIQFESSLERDFIYLLEFDTCVNKYLEQPIEIEYKDTNGKKRKYIPDFAISYHDNRPNEIVEIKYVSTLIANRDVLSLKFEAADKFCKKNKSVFKVVTDEYIRQGKSVELENYKFLSRYRSHFKNLSDRSKILFPYNSDLVLLHNAITQVQESTVKDLVEYCTSNEHKKAELLFLTWCLVATNFITIDCTKKINTNSRIWYNRLSLK